MKGRWHKQVWITFMTVAQMTRAWIEHYHKHGTGSWDAILTRLLSIVLVSSLGCRDGETARSDLYTGTKYMQWRHVQLMMDGDNGDYEDLRAEITIEFPKRGKDVHNKDLTCYSRPLNNPRYNHMDPIALLLVHVLRHGLVEGSTIQQVLQNAVSSPERRVQWLFPDCPVLPAFSGHGKYCQLEKAAKVAQLQNTIQQMGIVSNLLSRVTVHSLRRGFAKDIAHLPAAADGSGFVSNEVRQALEHGEITKQSGITERYVGAPTRELHNARVDCEYDDRWGPKFSQVSGADFIKPVTKDEVRAWQDINEPNGKDRNTCIGRECARRNICWDHFNEFVATTEPELKGNGSRAHNKATTISKKSSSKLNIIKNPVNSCEQQHPDPVNHDEENDVTSSVIDSHLLEYDSIQDAVVDEKKIEALSAQVFLKIPTEIMDQDDHTDESVEQVFLKKLVTEVSNTDELSMSAINFISTYSQINLVSNWFFSEAWARYTDESESYADSIG